jgi:hypothetical protein
MNRKNQKTVSLNEEGLRRLAREVLGEMDDRYYVSPTRTFDDQGEPAELKRGSQGMRGVKMARTMEDRLEQLAGMTGNQRLKGLSHHFAKVDDELEKTPSVSRVFYELLSQLEHKLGIK